VTGARLARRRLGIDRTSALFVLAGLRRASADRGETQNAPPDRDAHALTSARCVPACGDEIRGLVARGRPFFREDDYPLRNGMGIAVVGPQPRLGPMTAVWCSVAEHMRLRP
jgi:hypothetical protein